jgi:hypothetical protein
MSVVLNGITKALGFTHNKKYLYTERNHRHALKCYNNKYMQRHRLCGGMAHGKHFQGFFPQGCATELRGKISAHMNTKLTLTTTHPHTH